MPNSSISSRRGALEECVARDVGVFVQAVAALELALDDLLCLANSRFNAVKEISKSYPVQLTQKLACIPSVAVLAKFDLNEKVGAAFLDEVHEFRQRLVHGQITAIGRDNSGYLLTVAKMGRPEKLPSGQVLHRDSKIYSSEDVYNLALKISLYRQFLEELRECVFKSGKGWPSYIVLPEGDPLGLGTPHTAMSFNFAAQTARKAGQ